MFVYFAPLVACEAVPVRPMEYMLIISALIDIISFARSILLRVPHGTIGKIYTNKGIIFFFNVTSGAPTPFSTHYRYTTITTLTGETWQYPLDPFVSSDYVP